MKITDLLDPRSISLDAAPTSKSETLDKAVELMAASGKLSVCRRIFPFTGCVPNTSSRRILVTSCARGVQRWKMAVLSL